MRRQLTTPLEIKEEIVRMLQIERVFFKGKLPVSIKDLPKRYTMPSYVNSKGERIKNKYWTKARTTLCNAKRLPAKKTLDLLEFKEHINKTVVKPREERVHHNNNSISITLPSSMSATELIDLIAIIRKSGAKCSL